VTTVAISIGSNIGDRRAHIEHAHSSLKLLLENARFASLFETEPVGVPDLQPPFLNGGAVGETELAAPELLRALHAIERDRGRERPYSKAPRTLDLDLILYGGEVVDEPELVLPHPRFRTRRFVLEPLQEIAPDLVDPVTGKTVRELFLGLSA
jgi:2-amino-4-hydroxy-6-hydroxymethyldihydropteridine diphosphokinase